MHSPEAMRLAERIWDIHPADMAQLQSALLRIEEIRVHGVGHAHEEGDMKQGLAVLLTRLGVKSRA